MTFFVGAFIGAILAVTTITNQEKTVSNKQVQPSRFRRVAFGTTRRGRIARIVGAFVIVPVAAFAVIFALLGVSGTIGVKASPTADWTNLNNTRYGQTAYPVVIGDNTGVNGTATIGDGEEEDGPLSFEVKDAYAGSIFTVVGRVQPATDDMVLGGIDLGTGVDATLVKGVAHEGDATNTVTKYSLGCGDSVARYGNEERETSDAVAFRITVPQGASAGTITVPSNGVGVKLIPSAQWQAMSSAERAAMCTHEDA